MWLAERMSKLGFAITEAIIEEFGTAALLQRLGDPFWFQGFGAVMGMDWHSSGITTSVLGALKRAVNPHAKELGIYVCGGKGKQSRNTPMELIKYGAFAGIDGEALVRSSKLSAKVDNTAVQDGFQLYLHSFIVDHTGKWTVVQQGMRPDTATARRYHWHSADLKSFVSDPHSGIAGLNQGHIMNLAAKAALPAQNAMMSMTSEDPARMLTEIRHLKMPGHHDQRMWI
jgi:hypothetical protein